LRNNIKNKHQDPYYPKKKAHFRVNSEVRFFFNMLWQYVKEAWRKQHTAPPHGAAPYHLYESTAYAVPAAHRLQQYFSPGKRRMVRKHGR
jgi:hypothetical protein